MSLSSATLATQLGAMAVFSTEAAARTAWAAAFRAYFAQAVTSTAVPVIAGALGTPEAAMAAGLSGLSVTGAVSIRTGLLAFWTSLAASPSSYFAAATLITPPAGLAALDLTATFASNQSGALSKAASMNALAGVIHAANAGGQATFPGPITGTIQ